MELLKFVSIFLTVFMTIVNVGNMIRGNEIKSNNIILQALGITAVLYFYC